MGYEPWLLSFSGMAEVFGWPPRLPLNAPEHRARILSSWGGVKEVVLPFAEVRGLSPEAFVDLLAEELRVQGVLCGANFRFGYKAAGDAPMLRDFCSHHGIGVSVVPLVSQSERKISSTAVREALGNGDLDVVTGLLGRPHSVLWRDVRHAGEGAAPVFRLQDPGNQPPGDGAYMVSFSQRSLPEGLGAPLHGTVRAKLEIHDGVGTLSGFDAAAPVQRMQAIDGEPLSLSTTFESRVA